MQKIKHLSYDQINDYIYLGTSICCRVHFEKLLDAGIVADIDLEEEKMDKPSGVTAFLWLPVKDYTAPSQSQLIIGAHFIEDLMYHKMPCYVHCNQGLGRAPTLVAAYLILNKKFTSAEAIKFVKTKRPKSNPNKGQVAALDQFYKYVVK